MPIYVLELREVNANRCENRDGLAICLWDNAQTYIAPKEGKNGYAKAIEATDIKEAAASLNVWEVFK